LRCGIAAPPSLLRDVRELVAHQASIRLALAGAEEHIAAVRECACAHRPRRLL